MYSDVWSLNEMKHWSVNTTLWQWNCLSNQSLLQLYSIVSNSSFKNVTFLAAILCYYGYWNGIKKDQWWTVNHEDVPFRLVHLIMWRRYGTPCCEVCTGQFGSKCSHFA